MSATRARGAVEKMRRPSGVTAGRWVAFHTVRRSFDDQAYADRVFSAEAERAGLDARDRAFAQWLAFGTVQNAKTVDYVIGAVGKRPLRKIDAPVLHALRIGMYQLLYSDGTNDHAAVDQSVEIVRAILGERAVAFTNAVLRRGQVDGRDLIGKLDLTDDDDLATSMSFPVWMVQAMRAAFGESGIEALAAQNIPIAGASLRINTLATTGAEVDADLSRSDVSAIAGKWLPEMRVVEGSLASLQPAIDAGLLLPQSEASALVAHAVDPQPGERVLDMCAAPGGKATHLAALMNNQGSIVACELHQHRAESITALAERTGASIIDVQVGDATQLDPSGVGEFDRVLIDAPCSGLGVLRGRPDSRWHRSGDDLDGLIELQQKLIEAAAKLVRVDGVVVYSTCTMLPDENEQIIEWATTNLPLVPDNLPSHAIDGGESPFPKITTEAGAHSARTWPHTHGSDGFFVARLRRTGGGAL